MVCTQALIAGTKGTSYTNNWCGTGRDRESLCVTQKRGLGARPEGKRLGQGFCVTLVSPKQRHHLAGLSGSPFRQVSTVQARSCISALPWSCTLRSPDPAGHFPLVPGVPQSWQSPKVWPRELSGAAAHGASFSAGVAGFNIYENQAWCIFAYVPFVI